MQQISKLLPLLLLTISACGVKGPPSPPIKPAFIGNGEHPIRKSRKEVSPNLKDNLDIESNEAADTP